jgi:hypothetical protein
MHFGTLHSDVHETPSVFGMLWPVDHDFELSSEEKPSQTSTQELLDEEGIIFEKTFALQGHVIKATLQKLEHL